MAWPHAPARLAGLLAGGAYAEACLCLPRACRAAYEILSDAKKREIYDRYGEDGLKQHQARESAGGGRQGGDIFDM